MYKRPVFKIFLKSLFRIILTSLKEDKRVIQVLAGPRQTGKTTLARQLMDSTSMPVHYATADEPALKDIIWLQQQWDAGRFLAKDQSALLILDEIHKIPGWLETVNRLWHADIIADRALYIILLCSSPLLFQQGLTSSQLGKFEIITVPHWSFSEMRDAFGWELDQYIFYGGYPAIAELITDEVRWSNYIMDFLIETSVSRDILLMTRVDKPALLRRLFELSCLYSGQVLPYQRMLSQLHDAGNTTTLAHYLDLLNGAGLISGVPKYNGLRLRQRASSPKLLALNTALISVHSHLTFKQARKNPEFWGRLVESVAGAHLANATKGNNIKLFYWLERSREVDFILVRGDELIVFDIKTGRRRDNLPGFKSFTTHFQVKKKFSVGTDGFPVEEFLTINPEDWFD